MKHPLTDEICDALWDENGQYYALYEEVRLTCRAAYDKGADWQLEQVIKWLDEQGYYFVETDDEGNFLDDPEPNTELLYRLKKTMRP